MSIVYSSEIETPCPACKGLGIATMHLTLTPHDTEAALSLCPSCLSDAPSWAGWPTWTDHMKAQRTALLSRLSVREEVLR